MPESAPPYVFTGSGRFPAAVRLPLLLIAFMAFGMEAAIESRFHIDLPLQA